jgi:tRNA (mo5U34)-methyltransferase
MDVDEKQRRVGDYAWYHTVDLGDGVVTPGQYDHRPLLRHYGIPDDITGKSVLDVGPAHGYFAFELEARGAARVVTVELAHWSAHDGSEALKEEFDRDRVDVRNEPYLHGALEFAIAARGSSVEQTFSNVYDLSPATTGMFDLVFCGSMLIHLTDPLRALYAIRSVTRETAIIATTIDPMRVGRAPRARFVGTATGQTFWEPNMACLERWALAAGFADVEQVSRFRLRSVDGRFDEPHGTIRAHVNG